MGIVKSVPFVPVTYRVTQKIKPITRGFVFTSLVSLNTSKATGVDEISPKLLKLVAPIIIITLDKFWI